MSLLSISCVQHLSYLSEACVLRGSVCAREISPLRQIPWGPIIRCTAANYVMYRAHTFQKPKLFTNPNPCYIDSIQTHTSAQQVGLHVLAPYLAKKQNNCEMSQVGQLSKGLRLKLQPLIPIRPTRLGNT